MADAIVVGNDVDGDEEGGTGLPFGVPPHCVLRGLGDEVGGDPPEFTRLSSMCDVGLVSPFEIRGNLPWGSVLPRVAMTSEAVGGRKGGSYHGRVS